MEYIALKGSLCGINTLAITELADYMRSIGLPIPDFRSLDTRVDDRLNEILHRALARDLAERYVTGDELLYDLEHYIYHSGYGPTNETLGKFMRELFDKVVPPAAAQIITGSTKHFKRTPRGSPGKQS